MNNRNRRF